MELSSSPSFTGLSQNCFVVCRVLYIHNEAAPELSLVLTLGEFPTYFYSNFIRTVNAFSFEILQHFIWESGILALLTGFIFSYDEGSAQKEKTSFGIKNHPFLTLNDGIRFEMMVVIRSVEKDIVRMKAQKKSVNVALSKWWSKVNFAEKFEWAGNHESGGNL